MPKFTVSTSLFEPVEVEIEGIVYTVSFDQAMMNKIEALVEESQAAKMSSTDYTYRQLGIFLGNDELVRKWNYAVVRSANGFISENTLGKVNLKKGPEKNASSPE